MIWGGLIGSLGGAAVAGACHIAIWGLHGDAPWSWLPVPMLLGASGAIIGMAVATLLRSE